MATTPEQTPDFTAVAEHAPGNECLAKSYRLVAELFVNPERTDRSGLVEDAETEVLPTLADEIGEEAAATLRAFLDEYESVSVEEYIQTHELSPACPLYLGHYAFDEPETCRDISDADRNQYMVELKAIYEHYGFEVANELPDFLPAIVEFCWLTLPDRGDALREDLQRKVLALLPAMQDRFKSSGSPYGMLLDVLEHLISFDITNDPTATIDVPDVDDIDELLEMDDRATVTGGER